VTGASFRRRAGPPIRRGRFRLGLYVGLACQIETVVDYDRRLPRGTWSYPGPRLRGTDSMFGRAIPLDACRSERRFGMPFVLTHDPAATAGDVAPRAGSGEAARRRGRLRGWKGWPRQSSRSRSSTRADRWLGSFRRRAASIRAIRAYESASGRALSNPAHWDARAAALAVGRHPVWLSVYAAGGRRPHHGDVRSRLVALISQCDR
jgi:hypothetical protein